MEDFKCIGDTVEEAKEWFEAGISITGDFEPWCQIVEYESLKIVCKGGADICDVVEWREAPFDSYS
jgi:hypothetical protein